MSDHDLGLLAEYARSKVIKRLVSFQLVPLALLAVLIGVESGRIIATSLAGIRIAVAFGFTLYAFFSWLMIRMITNPALLRISRNGGLSWNIGFGERHYKIPSGTTVDYKSGIVTLEPSVEGIPYTRNLGTKTIIQLPSGIKDTRYGTFVIN